MPPIRLKIRRILRHEARSASPMGARESDGSGRAEAHEVREGLERTARRRKKNTA
jgi:hypothetical protein